MPITSGWDDDNKSRLLLVFEGGWTKQDLVEVIADNLQLLDSIEHTVDIIVDYQGSWIPPSISAVYERSRAFYQHPNAGMTVMVTTNPIVRMFLDTFLQFVPGLKGRFRFVGSMAEAHTLLLEQRAQNSIR